MKNSNSSYALVDEKTFINSSRVIHSNMSKLESFLTDETVIYEVNFTSSSNSSIGPKLFSDSRIFTFAALFEALPNLDFSPLPNVNFVFPFSRCSQRMQVVAAKVDMHPFVDGVTRISITPSLLTGFQARWNRICPQPAGYDIGSRQPNNPLGLFLGAIVDTEQNIALNYRRLQPGMLLDSLLLENGVILMQDGIDVLRQEYLDSSKLFGWPVGESLPKRQDIIAGNEGNDMYNRGNYAPPHRTNSSSLRLGQHLEEVHKSIVDVYNNSYIRQVDLHPLMSDGLPVKLHSSPTVTVTSAYRNPKRNIAVGSKFPFSSYHIWGRALDLGFSKHLHPTPMGKITDPSGVETLIPLNLHHHLFPTLLYAAKSVATNLPQTATAFTEIGSIMCNLGNPLEDHVHIQWRKHL